MATKSIANNAPAAPKEMNHQFVSLTEAARSTHRRPGRPKGSGFNAAISVRIRPPDQRYGNNQERLHFQIREDAYKQAGMEIGDSLDIAWNPKTKIGAIYKSATGYALHKTSRTNYNAVLLLPHVVESGFPVFKKQTALPTIEIGNGFVSFQVPETEGVDLSWLDAVLTKKVST